MDLPQYKALARAGHWQKLLRGGPELTSGGLDARRSLSRRYKVLQGRRLLSPQSTVTIRAGLTAGIKPAARDGRYPSRSHRFESWFDQWNLCQIPNESRAVIAARHYGFAIVRKHNQMACTL